MPKLNKCKWREKRQGFAVSYKHHGKPQTHYSTNIWARCTCPKIKWNKNTKNGKLQRCKGWNCGFYEEEVN
jgi:hypothetical protein